MAENETNIEVTAEQPKVEEQAFRTFKTQKNLMTSQHI